MSTKELNMYIFDHSRLLIEVRATCGHENTSGTFKHLIRCQIKYNNIKFTINLHRYKTALFTCI